MATLHLIVGLPCSGKTTYARTLAEREGALLLTPDVWCIRLFGDTFPAPDHDRQHDAVEAIQWNVAEDALRLGLSVILDFGFWAREEREDFRQRAAALGVGFRIHYMEVAEEELFRRLARRNAEHPAGTFVIPPDVMKEYVGIFQPPDAEELR